MALTNAMAETVHSETAKPPPKRRRILNLSAVVPVPIYSNQVSSSLQLKLPPSTFSKETTDDPAAAAAADNLLSIPEPPGRLSDSEEEEEEEQKKTSDATCCPSPPPPVSPVQQQSQHVLRKISEVDRKLRDVSSLLSPEPRSRRVRRRRGGGGGDGDVISSSRHDDDDDDDDDVTIVSPPPGAELSSTYSREFPLKVRCRADIHKVSVLSSTLLGDVVAHMSRILDVPCPRLILMREEAELPVDVTVQELGLCIADIIECVVMAAEGGAEGGAVSSITVKLQSNDRDSALQFTLNRDAPLGSVFAQYLSQVSRQAATFHFDGARLSPQQTPAQLDMEDDDIIQVWS